MINIQNKLLLRNFKTNLYNRDIKYFRSFLKLKYGYDYPDICYIVDNIENNKIYNDFIYGCSIPNTITELGDAKVLYGDANDVFEKEVNWSLLSIRKFKDEVQLFIDKKELYEKAIIIGNYDDANLILDFIENKICFSLWGVEQRFLLIEIQKGLKENTKYLNEINEQNKKWFIKYFSHFFSLKAEKELSINQYNLSLARLLFKYVQSDNHVDLRYYNFKLNFFDDNTLSYLPDFLAIEGYHSIIDKYLSLIRILQLEVLKKNKEKKEFLDSRLYYLSKKITDKKIDKLRLLISTDFKFNYKISNSDKTAIQAIDLYTNGDFDKAAKILNICITSQPLSIELYEIYIKTLIILNQPLKKIGKNNDSFQNKILEAIYNIFSKGTETHDNLNEIRKIAYNLSAFYSVSFYLMSFYKRETENNETLKPLFVLNSNFINPLLVKYSDSSLLSNIIDKQIGISSTLKYLKLLNNSDLSRIEKSELSSHRKQLLKANYFQKKSRFEDAIKEWRILLNLDTIKDFQKEIILKNIFLSMEALGEYDNCIDLYVNNYFINLHLVSNIDVNNLKKNIKKAKFKNVKYSINLPLFYKLTESEDYDIHTAYECFILDQKCYTPTEFISKNHNLPKNKLVFFLNAICTLDIFKHSPFITSSKQKYTERISVCNFLSDFHSDFQKDYQNEVERLTKKLIVQKGIQEIDESKIYVNQIGIIESELKNIESIFKRFKMIGELKSEKDISMISLYSDKMYSFKHSNSTDGSEFSKDPQFDVYKDIFYFVRDKFLFSNYGLQQYLSARIRHGVLLGEIRPEFKALKLITEKEKGVERYKPNNYWDLFLSQLTDTGKSKFQEIFSEFSQKVDGLINDEILSKSLQIKTEDNNPEGWLDYIFKDFLLQFSYVSQKDDKNVEEFVNAIFEILWKRTEKNLIEIKEKINGKIKDSFFSLLLELEKKLNSVFGEIPELMKNNITESRVNIENKLIKIANWFSIIESNISDFNINKIVDVSLEYSHQITPKLNINCNSIFKGQFYPPMVDLFRIFFDNTVKHSGFETGNIEQHITVSETNNDILIQLVNPLSNSTSIDDLNNKINSFALDLSKSMVEVNSGWHKAMRIIKSDLNSESNDMKFSLNTNNEFCVDISINKVTILA